MSGSGASTRASAARRASPPDRRCGSSVAGQIELFEQKRARWRIVARRQARLDIGERRGEAREIRLLRQIADGRAGLEEALARIELDEPRRDPEQRRLAGAVAPDQRQPLPRRRRRSAPRSSGVPPKVRWIPGGGEGVAPTGYPVIVAGPRRKFRPEARAPDYHAEPTIGDGAGRHMEMFHSTAIGTLQTQARLTVTARGLMTVSARGVMVATHRG